MSNLSVIGKETYKLQHEIWSFWDSFSCWLWKTDARNFICRNNYTVKAFVVTPPKMTRNSIIFRGGYDKGYKIFIADEILFVCILIYLYVS